MRIALLVAFLAAELAATMIAKSEISRLQHELAACRDYAGMDYPHVARTD